jgi:hypothetical protein
VALYQHSRNVFPFSINVKYLEGHLTRNEALWRAWREDGVTERTPLTVDFNFYATSKATAEGLAAALREVGLESVEVGRTRSLWFFRDWAVWGVEGGTWSLERLQDRTRTFCQLASHFRCRMEGCGAMMPDRNDSEPGASPNGGLAKRPAERTIIEAEITFLAKSEGGTDIPDGSFTISWRPHIVIGDPSQRQAVIRDGNQLTEAYLSVAFCDGPQHVEPGQPARTTMALISPKTDYSAAVPGATFTMRILDRIIGYGKIERRWTEAWTARDSALRLLSSPEME